jgi:hypothetical protein
MNITPIVFGSILVALGVFAVIRQVKELRSGTKDPLGLETRFLVSGIVSVLLAYI